VSIFRPWRQDERPAWRAQVEHELAGPLDGAGRAAVGEQAGATGLARAVLVTDDPVAGTVTVHLLVKAEAAAEAAHVATRVVEAAHREAGSALLGAPVAHTVRRYRALDASPTSQGRR